MIGVVWGDEDGLALLDEASHGFVAAHGDLLDLKPAAQQQSRDRVKNGPEPGGVFGWAERVGVLWTEDVHLGFVASWAETVGAKRSRSSVVKFQPPRMKNMTSNLQTLPLDAAWNGAANRLQNPRSQTAGWMESELAVCSVTTLPLLLRAWARVLPYGTEHSGLSGCGEHL